MTERQGTLFAVEGTNAYGDFDGATFDRERDGSRLFRSLQLVKQALSNGAWWLAADLAEVAGCNEAAAGARARDLRKTKFGGLNIECKRFGAGLWKYRMVK